MTTKISDSMRETTALDASKLTGTIPDARFPSVLPAISGADLTNLPAGGVDGITSSANATAITISADEEVQMPLQPCFQVTAAAQTDQTGDGTHHTANLTQEVFDVGGNFAAKTFTAPVTGKYILSACITWVAGQWGATDGVWFEVKTSNRSYVQYQEQTNYAARDMGSFSLCHVADMDASDTAYMTWHISGGTKTADHAAGYYTMMSGILIA